MMELGVSAHIHYFIYSFIFMCICFYKLVYDHKSIVSFVAFFGAILLHRVFG